jgi:hypothetical protein
MAERVRYDEGCPPRVREFADQAVEYVRRAVGMDLEFDSDTLPILDHYLRTVPLEPAATSTLVACAAGAYFGEVVRRLLGGEWELASEDPAKWRFILPGGLSLVPAGVALSAIARDDDSELEAAFSAPGPLRDIVQDALERMGQVSEEDYYSLCCRLDTLEHLQSVIIAFAASRTAPDSELS